MPDRSPPRPARALITAFRDPIRFAYRPPHTPTPDYMIDLLREADQRSGTTDRDQGET